MIKHGYEATEFEPKAGKVSGQAWNAHHKFDVGFSTVLGAWDFEIDVSAAQFFGNTAVRTAAGTYDIEAPGSEHYDFADACFTGLAEGQLVVIPHTPLPSGWRFSIENDGVYASDRDTPPVVRMYLLNDSSSPSDPSAIIRGQAMWIGISAYEPA